MKSRLLLLCLIIVNSMTGVGAAEVNIHKNENTGLLTWSLEDNGFSIELIQLLPDFVRAIYAKHDFPKVEIERIAEYCVFGTILKNTSQQNLSYKVADWSYRESGTTKTFPVKTKTQWLQQWQKADIKFSWTLLPDIGEFSVGDWQQGFTTIKLPRASQFDLLLSWQLDGVKYETTLPSLSCPPDLEIEPG